MKNDKNHRIKVEYGSFTWFCDSPLFRCQSIKVSISVCSLKRFWYGLTLLLRNALASHTDFFSSENLNWVRQCDMCIIMFHFSIISVSPLSQLCFSNSCENMKSRQKFISYFHWISIVQIFSLFRSHSISQININQNNRHTQNTVCNLKW